MIPSWKDKNCFTIVNSLFVRQWIKLKKCTFFKWKHTSPQFSVPWFCWMRTSFVGWIYQGRKPGKTMTHKDQWFIRTVWLGSCEFFGGGFLSSSLHQSLNIPVQCNLKIRHIFTFFPKPSDPGCAEHSLWAAMPENNDRLSSQMVLGMKHLVRH